MEIRNIAKERLEAGELALGVGLRQARTVDVGKIMKTCGFDWLFIDMEHNSMDLDTAVQISVAAQDTGITPIVRVPGPQHFHATRVLDGGAQGIVVPHVDTAEVAAEMVSNCKYPPLGHRSVTGTLPQLDFESHSFAVSTPVINAATLLIVMLETPLAIANAMERALTTVVAACNKHGKYAGLGGVYAPALLQRYVSLGMRFILSGNDVSLMMAAAKERTQFMRKLKVD